MIKKALHLHLSVTNTKLYRLFSNSIWYGHFRDLLTLSPALSSMHASLFTCVVQTFWELEHKFVLDTPTMEAEAEIKQDSPERTCTFGVCQFFLQCLILLFWLEKKKLFLGRKGNHAKLSVDKCNPSCVTAYKWICSFYKHYCPCRWDSTPHYSAVLLVFWLSGLYAKWDDH